MHNSPLARTPESVVLCHQLVYFLFQLQSHLGDQTFIPRLVVSVVCDDFLQFLRLEFVKLIESFFFFENSLDFSNFCFRRFLELVEM